MTVFVAILLTLFTFSFVSYPLFMKRFHSTDEFEDERLKELYDRKDNIYSMLCELELDFQSGIIIEKDYHDLKVRYKRKAIFILRDIDNLRKTLNAEADKVK